MPQQYRDVMVETTREEVVIKEKALDVLHLRWVERILVEVTNGDVEVFEVGVW